MNINQIITAVQRLHQKTSLTSDERASILQGLNDARAFAEREHDFHALMNFGYALVDPTDGGRFDWNAPTATGATLVEVFDSLVTYEQVVDYNFYVLASDLTVWAPGMASVGVDPADRTLWVLGATITAGDVIMIEDGGDLYHCTTTHVAAALNKPVTGGDWTDFYDPDIVWFPASAALSPLPAELLHMRDVHLAEWWDENLEVWVPMDLVDAKTLRARWDTQNALDNAQSFAQPTLVIYGNGVIRIFGVEEEHDPYLVRLYGPFWLDEYVDVAGSCTQEDFLTKHGHDFLMWSAALDINMVFMTWIPRQEGAMPPPESRRERAWQSLLDWDNFQHLPRQQNYVK